MTNKTDVKPKTSATPSVTDEQGNGLAIASLVLGILSVTGSMFLTGIPAIITGVMSLKKGQKERSMSIAGIVMGSIGTLLSLLLLLMFLIIIGIGMFSGMPDMQSDPSYDTDINMPVESSRT